MLTKYILFLFILKTGFSQNSQDDYKFHREFQEIPSSTHVNRKKLTESLGENFYTTFEVTEKPNLTYKTPRHDLFPDLQTKFSSNLQQPSSSHRHKQDFEKNGQNPAFDLQIQGEDIRTEFANPPQQSGQELQFDQTPVPKMKGMPYNFEWSVADEENGNMYNHIESSNGIITSGEYSVLLPNGMIQVVTFTDRGNGYEATVNYIEFAKRQ